MTPEGFDESADRWLRGGVAFIWIATALGVAAPSYRAIGSVYLGRLGLPDELMYATCAAELVLGLVILRLPMTSALAGLQLAMIAAFSLILAIAEPLLLVHPFGILTKNLPLAAAIGAAWLARREGWTPRAVGLLRLGVAAIWLTEGIGPKILFQQAYELEVVRRSGLVPFDPSLFLRLMGAAQAASGVAVLALGGRSLRFVLLCQAAALVALPVLVSVPEPELWVHPFGPLTKNVPILAATLVLVRRSRCSSP